MTDPAKQATDPERFDRACANLAGALERFAALTAQIANDIRSTTATVRRAGEKATERTAA